MDILLQWSHGFSTVETPSGRAGSHLIFPPSMEPRFLNRGNAILVQYKRVPAWALQWSHGFSTVETTDPQGGRWVIQALQWSHGFSTVETSRNRR